MAKPGTKQQVQARRNAVRTALILGAIALAVYLFSIFLR
jgi:hypothetical protein